MTSKAHECNGLHMRPESQMVWCRIARKLCVVCSCYSKEINLQYIDKLTNDIECNGSKNVWWIDIAKVRFAAATIRQTRASPSRSAGRSARHALFVDSKEAFENGMQPCPLRASKMHVPMENDNDCYEGCRRATALVLVWHGMCFILGTTYFQCETQVCWTALR